MIKSRKGNFRFQQFNDLDVKELLTNRTGETRIGNHLTNKNNNAKFVILGIEESIGPLANNGLPGSENAFHCFLKVFLNTQVHDGFDVSRFEILGAIKHLKKNETLIEGSEQVVELDEFVVEILNEFFSENQIPIVIGGGHNNAYPLIKWCYIKNNGVNVINLDPHADCRDTNGRHSGNSFSYAIEEDILNNYAVLGLHEAFNNQFIREFLKNQSVFHTFYEDYLTDEHDLKADFKKAIKKIENNFPIGIEIDMDAIAYMPSSAFSPSGWTLDQVRNYLIFAAQNSEKLAYLHLPEASPKKKLDEKIVGKALAYLVRDFIINAKIT